MTDEPKTYKQAFIETAKPELELHQALGELVPGMLLVCNCNNFDIEYSNQAFLQGIGKKFNSLEDFLDPVELKKIKHAARFCLENNREEKATVKFNPSSDENFLLSFTPVKECSIVIRALPLDGNAESVEQKDLTTVIGNIQDGIGFGIWFFDLRQNRTTWSAGMYKLFEVDRQEADRKLAADPDYYYSFVDPADIPVIQENHRKFMASGEDFDMVYSITTARGNRKKIHTSIKALEKSEKEVVRCIGINRDITIPNYLSETLLHQASENSLKEKLLLFGTWEYDVASDDLNWSDGIYWLFGYDPWVEKSSLRLGRDFVALHVEEEEKTKFLNFLAGVGLDPQDTYEYSSSIIKKDGEVRKIESQVRVFWNENGEPVKLYGTSRDVTEKDQLMHELISYKEMVQEKEEFLGQGSFEYDLVNGRHFISDGLWKIYGINEEESKGLDLKGILEKCFKPEEQKRIYGLFEELDRTGGAKEMEVSALVNGVRKDLEVYAKVYKNLSGKTERIVGTTRDITIIKSLYNDMLHFKKDLSERELLLKHGTWEFDLKTGKYSISDGVYEVFGFSEFEGNFVMEDFFLPGEMEKAKANRKEVLEKGFAYIDDVEIRTLIGEERHIELFSKLVKNSEGEPERIIGIARDVSKLQSFKNELKDQVMRVDVMNRELTEAKRKLEVKLSELEQANHELQLYKQTMLDKDEFLNQGTWEWDIVTDKTEYSRGIYRLFGYHHREEMKEWDLLGRDIRLHMDDEEKKRNDEDWQKILEEADTYLREMEITTRDGYRRRLETFGKVFRDDRGNAYKVIGTTRDITKLKEYEQELEIKINELNRSNKDLEEFAYIASHDLHEPLRKLSTFGQRLSMSAEKELSHTNMDYLDRMMKAAENMRNLIDNLLEFSRVTRGAATFVKTSIRQIIEEVLNEQELRIEESGAEVTVENMPELEIVPSQIKQVFNNLLNNALKFIRPDVKPRISFRCNHLLPEERMKYKLKPNREYYRISVEDNGIGFDKVYADKIFQIFQRLHGKSEYSGSGIGLAICRKITDNHKGLIFAESEPGEGSVFSIILPNKP